MDLDETTGTAAPPGAEPAHGLAELFPTAYRQGRATTVPRIVVKPAPLPPPASALVPEPEDLDAALAPVLNVLAGRRLAALTGAGVSTDSGIPDYRSPGSPVRQPMTFQQFCSSEAFRRHYWARNHLGWRHLRDAKPNAGHAALAALEARGLLTGLVTQNIDLLHVRAGSRAVVHLHGRYDRVKCLTCGAVIPREQHDADLVALNPGWRERHEHVADVEVAPDADVVLESTAGFRITDCACGGVLIPDVVFFGSNTPRERVAAATAIVDDAAALLVAGSSLAVMSGLRFVRRAARAGHPVVILNRGPTRGDDLATVKVDVGTSRALPYLAARLPDLAP
ncbi:Sir2 family NAD-dependent protein deacetylase [Georgenia faecalis]|uniref:Sir2 family NAD-dependent protein deacetylase n=1 Tax=Georgenia faecalis TaxID=2483799 RepID=UPI000FDC89DA|nr:Sir2 family NAD-dependent protein deacetylase [Georgenia faecalis]